MTSLLKNYRWTTSRGDAALHLRPAVHRRILIECVVRLLLAISNVFFGVNDVSTHSQMNTQRAIFECELNRQSKLRGIRTNSMAWIPRVTSATASLVTDASLYPDSGENLAKSGRIVPSVATQM